MLNFQWLKTETSCQGTKSLAVLACAGHLLISLFVGLLAPDWEMSRDFGSGA